MTKWKKLQHFSLNTRREQITLSIVIGEHSLKEPYKRIQYFLFSLIFLLSYYIVMLFCGMLQMRNAPLFIGDYLCKTMEDSQNHGCSHAFFDTMISFNHMITLTHMISLTILFL